MTSENSVVLESATTLRERGENALDRSRLVALARGATARTVVVVRESFLYNWLTKEPDPEVVVIDLRETHTVGPVLRVIDAVVGKLAPSYRQSRLHDLVQAASRLTARAADTRLGRTIAALLTPPELDEEVDDVEEADSVEEADDDEQPDDD